jgi:hypothetical protein
MLMPNLLPALIRRRPGRVELTISMATRGLYAGLGALLILVLARDPAGRPLALMFAIVIALAVFSEDRWIFDSDAGMLRRRVGVLLLATSWAVNLATVKAIEVVSAYGGALGDDPYAKVAAGSKHDRCAIRLLFEDGKSLVLCSAGPAHVAGITARAQAIAEATGRPFQAS